MARHTFHRSLVLAEGESADAWREVTPAQKAQIEAEDEARMAPPRAFIDMWNSEGSLCNRRNKQAALSAKYDPENAPDIDHPFWCNKLWLTYDEAIDAFNHRLRRGGQIYGLNRSTNVRTAICSIQSMYAEGWNLTSLFDGSSTVEVVRLSTNDVQGIWATNMQFAFNGCEKLREVMPAIVDKDDTQLPWHVTFFGCKSLETVKIDGLSHNLNFGQSPLLSLESIAYMVNNRAKTNAITITLHPEAYARVTEEIFEAAAAKNVTIASA